MRVDAERRKESTVAGQIVTDGIHHLRLTVTDLQRSRDFYTSLLGFQVVVESPPADDPAAEQAFKILFGGVVMIRGNLLMGLRPMAPSGDRFDPDRVGLDHLSFGVASRGELEEAVRLFEERGVTHGSITRLAGFGIDVLPSKTRTACSSNSPRRWLRPRTGDGGGEGQDPRCRSGRRSGVAEAQAAPGPPDRLYAARTRRAR
jgi:catechol 2,3-dioxygenase-like lactoylglutathione lyase family enzyme